MIVSPGTMSSTGHREEFRRHSGWWIPGAFLLALVGICGLLLGWYLRPGVRPPNAPTEQSGLVWLKLHGTSFAIPANAIEDALRPLGVVVRRGPFSPRRVRELIESASSKGSLP